jgi:hypothetical protein
MARVRFSLQVVHCIETEDVTGPDEFYAVAVLVIGTNAPKTTITPIWSLNNGALITPDLLLFDEAVGPGQTVFFQIQCYDKDFGIKVGPRASEEIGRKAKEFGDGLRQQQGSDGADVGRAAAVFGPLVAGLVFKAIEELGLDKDDFLGQDQASLHIPALPGAPVIPFYPNNTPVPRLFWCLEDGAMYEVLYTTTYIP